MKPHNPSPALLGQRVLVTRSAEQAAGLTGLLAAEGAIPVELPTVSIQPLADYGPLDAALARLNRYDWAVFTSVNGVAFFYQRLESKGLDASALAGMRLCAIGPATAKVLTERGLAVDYVPDKYIAEAVVAGLKERGIAGARILLPRALEAREVIVAELPAAGATVDDIPVYQTIQPPDAADRARQVLASGAVDIVTFTSSSTVRNLAALLHGEVTPLEKIVVACIGPVTAGTARELGIRVDVIAAEHTMPGLVAAIVEFKACSSKRSE